MPIESKGPTRDEAILFDLADRVQLVRESHGPAEAIRVAEAALAGAAAAIVALGPPVRERGRKGSEWDGQRLPRQAPVLLFADELAGVGAPRASTGKDLAPLDAALDALAQRVQRVDRISNALARTEWGAQLAELVDLAKALGTALARLERRAGAVAEVAAAPREVWRRPTELPADLAAEIAALEAERAALPAPGAGTSVLIQTEKPRRGRTAA